MVASPSMVRGALDTGSGGATGTRLRVQRVHHSAGRVAAAGPDSACPEGQARPSLHTGPGARPHAGPAGGCRASWAAACCRFLAADILALVRGRPWAPRPKGDLLPVAYWPWGTSSSRTDRVGSAQSLRSRSIVWILLAVRPPSALGAVDRAWIPNRRDGFAREGRRIAKGDEGVAARRSDRVSR